jgi:hypothetical protein
MIRKRRGIRSLGRGIVTLLIITAIAGLMAPTAIHPAAAQDTSTTVEVQTRAMFLHGSPSLGNIEVSINWETKLEEFGYGDASDWIDIPPGAVEVSMNAERRGFNYLVYDMVYPAPAGNDYYAIITEQLVLAGAFDRSPIPDGGARVQVVQGSVSLPAVNVVATGANVDFATRLEYPRTSEYSSVPAGTYNLEFSLADSGQKVLSVPNVSLSGDKVYELVLIGNANDSGHPLELKVLEDSTQPLSGGTSEATSTPTS